VGDFFGPLGYAFNLIFSWPIFNGMTLLYYLFNDFGLAIIVLTIVIKLILFPLTLQQLKSMKATQSLQPKMAEIRKKYAKDQQGQAVAMQALYKEAGVNPLAGCLPLLIQMPVLYGMFNAFNSVLRPAVVNNKTETLAAHLERINGFLYPFIPHFKEFPNMFLNWFTWIGGPNFHISLADPDPTHILPIIAAAATFVQLRMSMARTAASAPANDPTTQQMKMMQYIMPLFTLYLGWTFPAGLALYWTVSTIFQGVQQYFVTGWGAMGSAPNLADILGFGGNKNKANGSNGTADSKAYRGDRKTERDLLARADEPEVGSDDEDSEEENGPIARKLPTRGGGNGSSGSSSSYNRRKGGRPASARRRSAQRSRG